MAENEPVFVLDSFAVLAYFQEGTAANAYLSYRTTPVKIRLNL